MGCPTPKWNVKFRVSGFGFWFYFGNNIPINVPIYIKFGKKAQFIVTNMPIKLKVKIFKISLVINYLRFGVSGFDFILALDIPYTKNKLLSNFQRPIGGIFNDLF